MARFQAIIVRLAALIVLIAVRWPLVAWIASAVRHTQAATIVGRVVDSLSWLAGASLLVTLTNALVWNRVVSYALRAPAPGLLRDTSTALIYGAAITAVVTLVFGGSLTAFWTASGALGLIIGLALRSIILDLFTGIAFSLELSFRIGDWLEIQEGAGAGFYGRVVGMSWRATRLELGDRRVVIVPNSRMGQIVAINSSLQGGVVRAEVLIPLEVAIPVLRAFRILEGAAAALAAKGEILADPAPDVIVAAVTQQAVEYKVRYWVDIRSATLTEARSAVLASILNVLTSADIAPVMPRRHVHLIPEGAPGANDSDLDRRRSFLSRVDLFGRALTSIEQSQLADAMTSHTIGAGENLLEEGEPGSSLYILCEGALAVYRNVAGKMVQAAILQPGEIVGEMSLLTGAPRSGTVKALVECLVYEIRAEALAPILQARPEIVDVLSQVAADRSRASEALRATDAATSTSETGLMQRIRQFFGAAQAG